MTSLYYCVIKNLIELDIDICTIIGHTVIKEKKTTTMLSSFTETTTELMLKIISPLWQGTEEGNKHDDCITPVKPEQFKSLYIRTGKRLEEY